MSVELTNRKKKGLRVLLIYIMLEMYLGCSFEDCGFNCLNLVVVIWCGMNCVGSFSYGLRN